MLTATLGTHEKPMARLVEPLAIVARDQPERGPFWIQHGWTSRPPGWDGEAVMQRERLSELICRADIVITHGGAATIAQTRDLGKIPIVVPRLSRWGEHVSDHQLRYTEQLACAGEVLLVTDPTTLPDVVSRYESLVAGLPSPACRDTAAAIRRFAEIADAMVAGERTEDRARHRPQG